MRNHRITKHEKELEKTFNLKDLLKIKVITKQGLVLGKVKQIRINNTKHTLEGIVVSQGILKKKIYIGSSYIREISKDSFILNIDPSILLMKKKVLLTSGKVIGHVVKVERKDHSNEIEKLIVKSPFKKSFEIKPSHIKRLGESIILKGNYHEPRKYFWQKSG